MLFADLNGSMELLADHNPEDARKILDPGRAPTMEAVHRYEGTGFPSWEPTPAVV